MAGNCKILAFGRDAVVRGVTGWSAEIRFSHGAGFVCRRTKEGVLTTNSSLVTARQFSETVDGVVRVAVEICGDFEVIKTAGVSADGMITFHYSTSQSQLSSKWASLLWACSKSGDAWVCPFWATNTPIHSPLVVPIAGMQTADMWKVISEYSGSAATNEDSEFKKGASAINVVAWRDMAAPVNPAELAIDAPYFMPSDERILYDNSAVAPVVVPEVPVQPIAPVTGTEVASDVVTRLEARMFAMQDRMEDIATAIGSLSTAYEVRMLAAIARSDASAVNGSVAAVGDYVASNTPSKQTRILETLAVSLAAGVVVRQR